MFQLSLKAKVKFELIEVKKGDILDENGIVRAILRVKVSKVFISIFVHENIILVPYPKWLKDDFSQYLEFPSFQ